MVPLLVWKYTIRARLPLNASARGLERTGALIRAGDGFGCLHPWPELGDAPLAEQLDALRAGQPTPLGERTLHCAAIDGAARRDGRWLFDGLAVPPSHVIEGSVPDSELEGYRSVKVKCGADGTAEAVRIRRLAERLPERIRLRLDFNEVLDAEGFARFLSGLPVETKARIDFIEDPVPYSEDGWGALPAEIPLAVDRASEHARTGFAFRVVKPAVQDVFRFTEPIIVTSYMDHPLGQLFAAYEAACYEGDLFGAGLLTHLCFEPEAFGERLTIAGGRLVPPPGSGLGFDDLLEALPWTRL